MFAIRYRSPLPPWSDQHKYGLVPRLVSPPGMDQGCEADQKPRAPRAVHVGWVGLAALLILADLPGINFSVFAVLKRFQRSNHASPSCRPCLGTQCCIYVWAGDYRKKLCHHFLKLVGSSHVMLQCWWWHSLRSRSQTIFHYPLLAEWKVWLARLGTAHVPVANFPWQVALSRHILSTALCHCLGVCWVRTFLLL